MRKILCYTLFFLLFSQTTYSSNSAEAALFSYLASVQSIHSQFAQHIQNEQGEVIQESHGELWLKKPGLFRWSVNQPDRYLIVADGLNIWNYDIDLSQITVQPSNNQLSLPALLLNGDIKVIREQFHIQYTQACSKNYVCFTLNPVQTTTQPISSVKIRFKKGMLADMHFQDGLGQETELNFINPEINTALAPTLFHFAPPRGVDVYGNPADNKR